MTTEEIIEKVLSDLQEKIEKVELRFTPITNVNANSFMDLRDQIFKEISKIFKEMGEWKIQEL